MNPVLVTRDGAIGSITLNRPERRNALNAATIDGISAGVADLDADDAIRVIVLRGNGPDFCAGADLEQLERIAAGADAVENRRDAQQLGDLFIAMRGARKPIIAAVQGNAIAGGAGLANACDIVLASEDAVFGYPEVHLGFVPAMVMAMLRRTVGEKIAFELVARGDRINAHDAQRIGIVNRTYSQDTFNDEVQRYTTELSRRSATALALIKGLFYEIDVMPFEEAITRGAEVNAIARSTDDCREGVRRFLERKRET